MAIILLAKSLIVLSIDSFTHSSSVLLLAPVTGQNGATEPAHLACVIQGISNLVWVSWHVPGEEPAQGLPRLLEARDGSLTLVHGISIPWASWASGAAVICQVTFNSSGSSVTRRATYKLAARSAPCVMLPVVAVGSALLLVTVPESHLDPLPSQMGIPAQEASTLHLPGKSGRTHIRGPGVRPAD
ncbi:hypothetical protein Y1Q_0004530 [Alligator mississippiensis]|uniref:Ig-like domain-containing protein n=1 Tax=Alligator mississippiensis TaxID=8496 RepID=A0A151MAP4_ALLMI|nr:hypothetical protein Y1Q_0004530 [Alligator mississippiensis]